MGIAPVRTYAPSVASLRIRSRALRALPFTALAIDLTLLTVTVLLAAYGRSRLPLFDRDGAAPGLTHATGGPSLAYAVAMVTVPLIIGWLLIIALRGGYDQGVFSGVLIFAGLTAYDTQKLKLQYEYVRGTDFAGKAVVMGALTLYLDFVNMFMFLLQLFGGRRN